MEQNYCRRCGTKLERTEHGGYKCTNEHIIFSNPAPTVGIFLFDGSGKVLLSIRGVEPEKGKLDSIGGFVEEGETFEEAAIRETQEETGLTAKDYSELTYLTSAPNEYLYGGERRSVLSCFYYATMREGAKPVASDDVASLLLLKPEDIDVDDVGNAQDIRAGLTKLLEMVS